MSLFRSEEHVTRWLGESGQRRGAVLDLSTVWQLSLAFYKDPRNAAWRPRTVKETQNVLTSVGLTGPFWQLTHGG